MPVIVPGELHQQVAASRPARKADRGHGGLRAGGHQSQFLHRRPLARPHPTADQFRQLGFRGGGCAERQPPAGGILYRGHDLGMRVAENRGTP